MKKFLLAAAVILAHNICLADSMLEWVAGADHVFGPEDVYPKKTAEEIYGRKIIESEDKPGFLCQVPDACGEDIFGPPLQEEEEVEEETDEEIVISEEE